jgi:predicted RNA-binding protein with PUA-like domain
MSYWLMKSEPSVFSIDDLMQRESQREPWDGVRNYQARNMMRDQMKVGDDVFFYHSNCEIPGIVGIARIASESYPDPTQFMPGHAHFDPKSKPEHPSWYLVEVAFVRKLNRVIPLSELKERAELKDFPLVRRGNRLSVMPVSGPEWTFILSLE